MSVEVQDRVVRKENQVLLETPGTKDRLVHRALKETQDQQGPLVRKGNRDSKELRVFQDHRAPLVLLANQEEKVSLDSRVKEVMTALKALKDQLDPQALQAPQGSWAPLALRDWMGKMENQG